MKSKNYKYWKSVFDIKRCLECEDLYGKIYGIYEVPIPKQPLHFRCRCKIEILEHLELELQQKRNLRGQIGGLNIMVSCPNIIFHKRI